MIMVDVSVPSIGRQYNFSLEEQAPISMVIAEISEVICQKENCTLQGEMGELKLCCVESEQILSQNATLKQYGVKDGNRLILI